MKCDADEIDIYSQKDTPLSVPATSLLVAVASNDDLPVCVLVSFF